MEQDTTKSNVGLVIILAVLLTAGSLIHNFWFDRTLARDRTAALALQQQIGALETSLSDVRGAQTGYLAVGQNPDFWMRRATELSERMQSSIDAARGAARSPEGRDHLDAAARALSGLMDLDARARDQIQMDQRLLAADILLSDGLEDTQRAATELNAAKSAEAVAAAGGVVRLARIRLGANLAVGLVFVLVAGLAARRPARPQTPASSAAQTAQMLRQLPPPVKAGAAAVTRPVVTAPAPPPPAPAPVMVNLPDAAELCVDLARVMDTRDVPTLLERAAGVLGAKGVILWLVEPDGGMLRPSLTHGYSDRVLARLEALEVAAENVTSLAFRSMRPQVMQAAAQGAAGAVAVPLVTPAGCAGVLAAETRESKPAPETVALARILAAQFATLIAPGDAGQARAAAEA